MSKQLILITAPFNCGYCERAKKVLPEICEKHGFELIEMKDEKTGDPDKQNGYDHHVDALGYLIYREFNLLYGRAGKRTGIRIY